MNDGAILAVMVGGHIQAREGYIHGCLTTL